MYSKLTELQIYLTMKDPYKTDVPLNNAENSFCDMPSDSRQSDMVRCGSQRQSFDPSVSFANLEMPAIKQTGKGDSVSLCFYHLPEPLQTRQANNGLFSGFPKRIRTMLD